MKKIFSHIAHGALAGMRRSGNDGAARRALVYLCGANAARRRGGWRVVSGGERRHAAHRAFCCVRIPPYGALYLLTNVPSIFACDMLTCAVQPRGTPAMLRALCLLPAAATCLPSRLSTSPPALALTSLAAPSRRASTARNTRHSSPRHRPSAAFFSSTP